MSLRPPPPPPALSAPNPGDLSNSPTRQLGLIYGSDGFPLATAHNGRLQVDVITGGGGGTSTSPFTDDGSTPQLARVTDTDTGAGAHLTPEAILVKRASGGPVDFGTSTDPVRTDPTGTTIQPVSGTFWQATQPVSAAALPLPAGAAADATLTGGTAKAIMRGGAKGATAAADVTSTASGANHNGADVVLYDAAGNLIDPRSIRLLTVADAVNVGQWIGSAAPTIGQKTAANSIPTCPASDWATVDTTFKALRTSVRPPEVLGAYSVTWRTGTYGGLAANTPLWSMRWGDATRFAIILKVYVAVVTSVSATTAGITERQLIIARSFTVNDTGGTAIVLTGNNNKRRTSHATSLVTDMRFGNPITAGTRTLDANPVHTALGWSGLLSTGWAIGAVGGSAVGAARSTEGGSGMIPLLDATNGQDYPIVLAQNEGIVVRIGTAEPAGATQETFGTVVWLEANAY